MCITQTTSVMRSMWISEAVVPVIADRHSVRLFERRKLVSLENLYYNDIVGRRSFGLRPVRKGNGW